MSVRNAFALWVGYLSEHKDLQYSGYVWVYSEVCKIFSYLRIFEVAPEARINARNDLDIYAVHRFNAILRCLLRLFDVPTSYKTLFHDSGA